ncbi:MAG: CinA family protein [Chloroflexi bacterium]|nr:CinA family protein [Chloroflexota bacterium]
MAEWQWSELTARIAERLRARGETVAVAESSTGGLVAAALLAIGGASAYFRGGAVVYTRDAKSLFLSLDQPEQTSYRPATEQHALDLARAIKERLGATWGIGETGATGPTGNRYGDPAGHTCIAVVGSQERAITIETGSADRVANMEAFTEAALRLFAEVVD